MKLNVLDNEIYVLDGNESFVARGNHFFAKLLQRVYCSTTDGP